MYSCAARRDSGSLSALISESASFQAPSVGAMARLTALTASLVEVSVKRVLTSELRREVLCGRVELGVGHHAVDQTQFPGLLRRERAAGEHQLLCHRRPDLAHKPRDAAPCERDPKVYLGNREARALARHTQVAGRGEDHTAADAVPADARHGDRVHRLDRLRHQSPRVRRLSAGGVTRIGTGEDRHVRAGAECASAPTDDHHPDIRLRVHPAGRPGELTQCLAAKRVELVRTIQGDRARAPSALTSMVLKSMRHPTAARSPEPSCGLGRGPVA